MNFDPRELEWQRRYEAGDAPWDKGAPSPALVRFLREGRIAGRVLVPGCGRGHEARALAGLPGISAVVGVDLSPAAIEEAQRLSATTRRTAELSFITGDFFKLPKKLVRSFDWLVEHTCFCAIEPRQRVDYVKAAATALRSDGKLFGIFYMNPDSDSPPPFGVTKDELSELFAPKFELLEEWIPPESFPGRKGRELVRVLQKR